MVYKILIASAILIAFAVARPLIGGFIRRAARRKEVGELRTAYLLKLINFGLFTLTFILLGFTIGFGYSEVGVILSSAFAVVGIALFAQWSILSNLTASLLIFFFFPYRVTDRIRVVDKDDDISGVIDDITLFHVIIRRQRGDLVTYPNNLILQKAVIKEPVEIDDEAYRTT